MFEHANNFYPGKACTVHYKNGCFGSKPNDYFLLLNENFFEL